ncbi:MAG: decaprenyl-phosphate phosphoribosyltransferase [Acidimicrobiia bacterium]|nr:decaprenyl-phosphate phosphoribosyltransferase [Acidimicrobiia bacterium]
MSTVARPVDRTDDAESVDRPPEVVRSSLVLDLFRSLRPKQWVKNVLVFAAPGAAGVLFHPAVLGQTLLAFVAFCLAASGMYLFNDTCDAEADRSHPVKGSRPVASGAVSERTALVMSAVLVAMGLGVAAGDGWRLAALLAGYVALSGSYTVRLKHVAVVDIAVVASGFIIRAVAGGLATNVPISQWFLIVASFGSLFVVAGKRHGEHLDLGDDRAVARPALGVYSVSFLRYLWMLASAVTITAYCLWAFDQSRAGHGFPWYELSIVPFVIGILRYALLLDCGLGAAPEDVILGDRTLQVVGVVWVGVFAAAVYLGH